MDCFMTAFMLAMYVSSAVMAASYGYGGQNGQGGMTSMPGSTTPSSMNQSTSLTLTTLNNFMLRIELITTAFYNQVVANFTAADFIAAGFTQRDYDQLVGVRDNENANRDNLISMIRSLGGDPLPPCIYSFPVTDVQSLLQVSSIIQNTDMSGYIYALRDIDSADIRTTLTGSLASKAAQAGFFNYLIGKAPAPGPIVPSLTTLSVASRLQDYIVSCSADSPPLFPKLVISPSFGPIGTVVTLTTSVDTTGLMCAINSGSGTIYSPVQKNSSGAATCTIPQGVKGLLYIILTRGSAVANVGTNATSIVAGPVSFTLNGLGDRV